ncbi:MAG: precorrin-4 C(11)-methyltransferase [Epulopiscium sp.]|jgi:precorrin-4/cobalt-precorrin-4 C11-methyltransferase|nr:precorrin-4 C(11)-methyltransferase [Candidatus Epulonipiscium sp.]
MVHFVGAGSGAKDLITVRGKKLLEKAEIVIYTGSLVNPELLEYTSEQCLLYDSAKMTLEDVLDVVNEHREKDIVRLHTGDPSIYGAIREQMDALDALGIEYDVCPGVSSFCGAAASLKMEYTLPEVAQTVIITRMAGKTPVPPMEDISLLAEHHTTMVIFLSTGMLQELSQKLMQGGYPSDTPAAIVYKATWPEEKIVHCTVATLAKAAQENEITKTALILVGEFLGDVYARSLLYHPEFTTAYREAKQ